MDCSCEIDIDTDDSAQCYRSTIVLKSKKEHKCAECQEVIPIGSSYESASYIDNGKYVFIKTCKLCVEIRDTFFTNGCYFNMMYELFYEHLDEIGGYVPESCLSKMSPEARASICDKIDKYHDEYEDDE